jgi:tetratricopeptide (TPR) repeat protein
MGHGCRRRRRIDLSERFEANGPGRNLGPLACGLCLLLLSSAAAQAPLPAITLESFPPSARDAISRVYREATANASDAHVVAALAKTLHAWELWEASLQAYERARQLNPASFECWYLEAVVLQRLARHPEAATRLREALAISPTYLPARSKLAEALFESRAFDESRALFSALAREPAAEPIAELGLGRIAAVEGRHDSAVTHLERAIVLFPELGAAHYALTRSYRALGRQQDARRAAALHGQYGPRWPALDDPVLDTVAALKDDATAHVRRGIKLAGRGDIEGAIAAHEAALARDASHVEAHANLISLYARAGKFTKAEERYRTVTTLGVNLADAHYDYGVLLGLQEKWDLAAAAYRAALAVNPLHAQAHNNLGQILERQQNFAEAAAAYRQALNGQPAFRLARFNLGRMLIAMGRPAEAISELGKLVDLRDAEAPRYLFALAVAHVRAGHRQDGITWATDAKQLAIEFGQHDLAAAIERHLTSLR